MDEWNIIKVIGMVAVALFFLGKTIGSRKQTQNTVSSRGKSASGSSGPRPGGQFERYGYKVDLGPLNWTVDKTMQLPADIRAAYDGGRGHFLSLPVFLYDLNPSLESLAAGYLGLFDLSLEQQQVQRSGHSRIEPNIEVVSLRATLQDSSGSTHLKFQVFRTDRVAHAFVAAGENDQVLDLVSAPLNSIVLSDPIDVPIESLGERERTRHAQVYNYLGLHLVRAGDLSQAERYFAAAVAMNPVDPVLHTNLATARQRLDKLADALEGVRSAFAEGKLEIQTDVAATEALSQVLENARQERQLSLRPLRALHGILEMQAGELSRAIAILGNLFEPIVSGAADPYLDHEAAAAFVDALERAGQNDQMRAFGSAYFKRTDSVDFLIAYASALGRTGAFADAVAQIEQRKADLTLNADLAYAYMRSLIDADQFQDCLDFCTSLSSNGQFQSASFFYFRARAHVGLGQFRESKADLERASQLAPGSSEIEAVLAQVSAMLGEGSNSLLKYKLEPVPIPTQLDWDRGERGPREEREELYYRLTGTAYRFDEDGSLRITDYTEIKVVDRKAAQQLQTFQFAFDGQDQIFVNQAVVRDGAGVEASTPVAEMYVMDGAEKSALSGLDKVLTIPLSRVAAGSTIRVIITRSRGPKAAESLWEDIIWGRGGPIQTAFVSVDYGQLRQPDNDEGKPSFVAEDRVAVGEYPGLIVFSVQNVPAFHPEPNAIHVRKLLPWICFTTQTRPWTELADSYLDTIADRLTPSDAIKELADQLRQKADGSTRSLIRSAFELVHSRIEYSAVGFGIRGRVPLLADETLQRGHGDCKDMTTLLYCLLHAAGIKAQLALANLSTPAIQEIPSLNQFDHMLLFVPDGSLVLDPTLKFHDDALQPPMHYGKERLLILERGGAHFIELPDYSDDSSHISVQKRVRADTENHSLIIEEQATFEGYYAGFLREEVGTLPEAYQGHYVHGRFGREGYSIEDFDFEGLESPREPVRFRVRYRQSPGVAAQNDPIELVIPGLTELGFVRTAPFANQRYPFVVRYPIRISSEIELDLARPFKLAAAPQPALQGKMAHGGPNAWNTHPRGLKLSHSCAIRPGQFTLADRERLHGELVAASRLFRVPCKLVPA